MQCLVVLHAKVTLFDGMDRVLRNQFFVNVIDIITLNCRFLNLIGFDLHLGNSILVKF